MDKIEILQKHFSTFRELKAKKPPREPKRPKEPESEKAKENTSYKAKYANWLKKMEQFKKDFEVWENGEERKNNIRQFRISADGTAQVGSAYRLIRIGGNINEIEEEYFLGSDGKGYPDFDRIVNNQAEPQIRVQLNVYDFKGTAEIIKKACESIVLNFITDDGVPRVEFVSPDKQPDPVFSSAKIYLRSQDEFEGFTFAIDTTMFSDIFKLASALKLQNLEMQFVSPVRPIRFVATDFYYLVAPQRLN